jgi:hypothetical protein
LKIIVDLVAPEAMSRIQSVREMRAHVNAQLEHIHSVIAGCCRFNAILCSMSDDPRLGIGSGEQYSLYMWYHDDYDGVSIEFPPAGPRLAHPAGAVLYLNGDSSLLHGCR